jgi:prepilin peptidase CpaA
MSDSQIFLCRFLVPMIVGAVAMIGDIRSQKIPNKLTVSLCVAGFIFQIATGGWDGLFDALLGFAVGFGLLLILFILGGGGGGDVKFMAAVGTWLGPKHITYVFVLSAILLLLLTLVLLGWHVAKRGLSKSSSSFGNNDQTVKSMLRSRIPYAVPATLAIAVRFAWMLLLQHN